MKCSDCQFDNRVGAKFCKECGTTLELVCPTCGSVIFPDSKFCDECGHDLTKPSETTPVDYGRPQSYTPKFLADKILTTRSSIEGERKLVTVLFADGAGRFKKFWHITLPLLKPVLAIVILFSTIFTFAEFNIVAVLTRGGPMNMTHLLGTLSFARGLGGGNLGQGAAISLFLFPILVVVFIQLRFFIRRDEIAWKKRIRAY